MAGIERDIQTALIGIISGLKHAMRFAMQESSTPLSPLYFIILKMIHDNENSTAIMIAQRCGRDKGQITRLIKELEKYNMVRKKQNPADKRSSFIELTQQGAQSFKTLESYDLEALTVMTRGLSDEQLQQYLEISMVMADNLARYEKSSN
ncbi:MarR family winged helix-turn-helix transcriptional regulator [Marinomonas atlantica]|uniref:MarR family winged helix-turn-helix transcriptional regulator n=1 Tax=Marinomonas atlantica TaxID=1806668 RepID=UPI00082D2062|nr:MarR family transcriptional regulator [Marinomonas atlantica]MCO4787206.1 MarR family transcriptional regulator [Marinomonas atlantica]